MGLLRDIQRRIQDESENLLDPATGIRGELEGYGSGAGPPLPPSPKRALFASSASSGTVGKQPGSSASRPTGSRFMANGGDVDSVYTSVWLTSLQLLNGVIGAGIISLPYAFYQAGLPMGIFLCLLVAIMSSWTVRLLAGLGVAHGSETYEDLCHRAFGPVGYYLVCLIQGLFSFGAMCSYLVIFADLIPPALGTWTNWGETTPVLLRREVVLAIPAVGLLLPLCLYRAYGQLAKYSIVKAIAITFLVITVVVSGSACLLRKTNQGGENTCSFSAPCSCTMTVSRDQSLLPSSIPTILPNTGAQVLGRRRVQPE